ncbi:hypothetical protein WAI453_004011 [Rhynchosporium graminicola]
MTTRIRTRHGAPVCLSTSRPLHRSEVTSRGNLAGRFGRKFQIPPVLAIFGDLWDNNSGPKLPLQNTSKAPGYLYYMTGDLAAAAHILESSRLTCDEQTDAHFILHTNALLAQVKMLQEKTDEAILLPRRALRYMEFSPFTAEKEWMTTAQNLGIMLIQQSLSDDDGTKLDMLAEAIQVLTKLLAKSAACSPEITSTH